MQTNLEYLFTVVIIVILYKSYTYCARTLWKHRVEAWKKVKAEGRRGEREGEREEKKGSLPECKTILFAYTKNVT